MTIPCAFDGTSMRKAKIKINYNRIIVETEGYKCPRCGEEFLTIEQAKKSRKTLANKKSAITRRTLVKTN